MVSILDKINQYLNEGYTGLSHWEDSDLAADFYETFTRAKTTERKIKLIDKELKVSFEEEDFNTSGPINIALVMKDKNSGLREVITKDQTKKLKELLKKEMNSPDVNSEHKRRVKKLLDLI